MVGVIPGSFLVSTDGGTQFRIIYADCTVALASKQNYVPKSGDIVMVKGVAEGTNGIKATQCAFVEHWFIYIYYNIHLYYNITNDLTQSMWIGFGILYSIKYVR